MPITDASQGGAGEPATHAFVITPTDNADLVFLCRALYVGGSGNLNVKMRGGETVLFSGVTAGTVLAIRVSQVQSTLTTATSLVGLY